MIAYYLLLFLLEGAGKIKNRQRGFDGFSPVSYLPKDSSTRITNVTRDSSVPFRKQPQPVSSEKKYKLRQRYLSGGVIDCLCISPYLLINAATSTPPVMMRISNQYFIGYYKIILNIERKANGKLFSHNTLIKIVSMVL